MEYRIWRRAFKMTTQEVADKLVGYCKQGNFRDALMNLYSNDIVSIEAIVFWIILGCWFYVVRDKVKPT